MTKRTKGGQFAPGVSGNPTGRPAVVKVVTELARDHTEEAISNLVAIMRNEKAPAQARVAACNAILDRGYGKPPQSVDLNSRLNLGVISNAELESVIAAIDATGQGEPTPSIN